MHAPAMSVNAWERGLNSIKFTAIESMIKKALVNASTAECCPVIKTIDRSLMSHEH